MNQKNIENTFFAIKLAFSDGKSNYWDIIRKVNTLPGAKGELLEVIALCMLSPLENNFCFSLKDFDMCKDLASIGACRVGYLVENEFGILNISGWEGSWNGEVKNLNEIDTQGKYKKNLFHLKIIMHDLDCNDDFFIETFFKRDRIFWGITQSNPRWLLLNSSKEQSYIVEKNSNWSTLIRARKSASSFNKMPFYKEELIEFLSNSLLKREDEHLHYGTAGGFRNIVTNLAVFGVIGLEDGLYRLDLDLNKLIFHKKFEEFDILKKFLFLNENLTEASVLMFFSIKFDEVSEKYGQRAIRLSLLTLGGALQQAHLAATSIGLKYRTIGGFDELQCGKIIGIRDREYLACAAILGK